MPSPDLALTLWAMLAIPSRLLYGRLDGTAIWAEFEDRERCLWMLRHPVMRVSPAPRTDRLDGHGARVSYAGCLWARVESGKASAALGRFSPRPTVVLSDPGTVRATALWALRSPQPAGKVHNANRAIACRLDSPRKHGDPAGFMFATGEAWVNADALYGGGEFVRAAGLRPPPDPKAWRQRQAA